MTKSTIRWRRRLSLLFCAILIFSMVLPLTAFADNAVVTSGSMYSYFQTYGSNGQWKDIQTPSHWITGTGEVAYCLQTSKDTPYNSSYTTVDGENYYSEYVLTGLMAIIQHGYPVTNAGFTDEQARYATANAIRFFLAENYADGMPQYLNLNVNGDWIRGKSGYEELYEWALYLVDLARWGDASTGSAGSLSFSPSTLTLTEDSNGQYFTGRITVNKNTSEDYGLAYNVPDDAIISGFTGTRSETLTIQIPTSYENKSYSLCAYGGHNGNVAKLFFWAPSATNQQRVVTYVLESNDDYLEGYATVKTPAAAPKVGNIQITKTDEAGNPLAGVTFELYDEYANSYGSGKTDSRGIITFSNLELGEYYYKELATLPGYILDTDYHVVPLTQNGQTVKVTVKNAREGSNVVIIKTDSKTGAALPGVHFQLTNGSGTVVAEGDTGADGKLSFSGIPIGSYTLKETTTKDGYVLDNTARTVTISSNGQTVEVRVSNDPATGSVVVVKTDADTGAALSGVHFQLTNGSGTVVAEGDTGTDGKLTFSGIALGSYTLTETATKNGYVLNTTPVSVSLTSNGQTVTKTITNSRAVGSVQILKSDTETGNPLAGVHFQLTNGSGSVVAEGETDADGRLTLSGIALGSYTLTETATVSGYALDSTAHEITISSNGQIVEVAVTNDPARGSVQVIKTDAETGDSLAGVHFKLLDSSEAVAAEGDTDTDGKLLLSGLALGEYSLVETSTVEGYVLDRTARPISLTENGQTVEVTVENSPIRGTLEITKKDAHEDIALMGAGFRLYDSAGTQVAEGYTNAQGKLSFSDLPRGSYTYQEFKAPKGYVLDESVHTVSITDAGAAITKTVTNERRPGTLIVKKQDADGSPLAGAAFLLEYSTDEGSTWRSVFYRVGNELSKGGCTTLGLNEGQLTTGEDGTATFTGLRADGMTLYRLTETKAPSGMSLMGNSILVGSLPVQSANIYAEDTEVFDAKAFHYTLTVTATDDPQYRLPEAGGTGFALLPFAMTALAAPIIFIKTKKEKTE